MMMTLKSKRLLPGTASSFNDINKRRGGLDAFDRGGELCGTGFVFSIHQNNVRVLWADATVARNVVENVCGARVCF
jgi:hypothetical protein